MEDDLVGGWPWAELVDIAGYVARTARTKVLPGGNREEFALAAILDVILATPYRVGRFTLVDAARDAIRRESRVLLRDRGLTDTGTPMPRYWIWHEGNRRLTEASFENRIDERLTLWAVWPLLSGQDRETLITCAYSESDSDAARSLGLLIPTYAKRLMVARIRARAIWADWETPAGHYGKNGGKRGPGWNLARAIQNRLSSRKHRERNAS